jgi:tRNA threonylcarbamoyladenosine biosynthesis protein TsaE
VVQFHDGADEILNHQGHEGSRRLLASDPRLSLRLVRYTERSGMTAETITHSPEETIALGRSLAGELSPPLIVLLRGDLGAGKTTLVKGIAEGFEAALAEDVTSPTFTLVHEYHGPHATLYHIDLYRIDSERELETLALDDLLAPNCILLVEWGEKFPRLQRDRNVEITLQRVGETERRIQRASH